MPLLKLVATEASSVIDVSQLTPILDSLTEQINVASIIGVVGAVIGAGIGFVFMWWGLRKLINSVMTAFKKGKLKF